MAESWDDYAGDWDTNSDVIKYSQLAYKSLLNITNLNGKKVLDFGCGTGLLTEKIAKEASSVLAMDTSTKMIEILADKKIKNIDTLNCELSKENIEKYPILNSKFDLIVASSVCAFISNFNEILPIIKSLLNPNGIFIQWDWKNTDLESDFGFSEESIKKLYKDADLAIVKIDTPFSIESQENTMDVIMVVSKK